MFRFKQFTVWQDRTPMKVGTDGVLLGAWADVGSANNILDIGTGTGLIALMSAQRNPQALIDAIDIEANACRQALENALASPWSERIRIHLQSLQDFFPQRLYDSIICNPPFFSNSTKAPDKGRSLARHCDTLPHDVLAEHVSRLLHPQGNFCVILPATEAQQMIDHAATHYLYPVHITHIFPNPDKPCKRYLIKFAATLAEEITQDKLVIELTRHHYSEDYQALMKDFYLYL